MSVFCRGLLTQASLAQNLSSHFRSLWTAPGPLSYIAPQTRLRIVDNSQFSSIAPEAPKGSGSGKLAKQAVAAAAAAAAASSGSAAIKDIKSFLQVTNVKTKREPMVICVYNHRNRGVIGDKVLLAVNGQKKKGWIVGCRMPSKKCWPRFESNNVVLVDDEGNPLGSRILVPIPAKLRSLPGDITKVLSIATTFV